MVGKQVLLKKESLWFLFISAIWKVSLGDNPTVAVDEQGLLDRRFTRPKILIQNLIPALTLIQTQTLILP